MYDCVFTGINFDIPEPRDDWGNICDRRIPIIKVIRAETGLGLSEAKALVDGAPSVIPLGDWIGSGQAGWVQWNIELAGGCARVVFRNDL